MVSSKSLLAAALLGLAALVDAAKPINPSCTQNACLSAVVRGSNPSGVGACQSFFRTVLTPDPVTQTVTKLKTTTTTNTRTITSSFSVTSTSTSTSTSTATSTSTSFTSTITSTVTSTSTSTSVVSTATTSTSTFGVPSQTCNGPAGPPKLRARTVTSTASTLPKYASRVCHDNLSSYSSACSCIGATHTTSTAATPTVKTTLHSTIVSTTSTVFVTSVTSTLSTSALASTTTTTTTVLSTDTTTTASTSTTVTTTSTSYTTTITTTVTSCFQPQPTFSLLVTSSGPDSGEDAYVTTDNESGTIVFNSTGTLFTRDAQCNLQDADSGDIANIEFLDPNPIYLNSNHTINDEGYYRVVCVPLDPSSDVISCDAPSDSNDPSTLQSCGRGLYLGTTIGNRCNAITLVEQDIGCPS